MKLAFVLVCVFAVPQFVYGENNVTSSTSTLTPTTTGKPDTTTLKPNTTTTAPVTTTVEPTPKPEQDAPVVHYVLKDTKLNHSCLMAEFSAVIELKYNNTKGHMETGYLSLSNTSVVSKADSHCGENETRLVIVINGDLSNTLTFVVEKKNNKYFVRDVLFEADENSIKDLIPLAPTEKKIAAEMVNQTLFEAPATKSYLCKTQEHYKMTSEVKDKFEVTLDMKDVRFDAFRTSGDSYRDGQLCSDDTKISDTVPIIVGAALAALVVIVLIAYFIGRRRSRRLAYQSV